MREILGSTPFACFWECAQPEAEKRSLDNYAVEQAGRQIAVAVRGFLAQRLIYLGL
jgi:hypothetical protein